MRFIPIQLHIAADYLSGLFLVSAPWLFGWPSGSIERIFPIAAGLVIILMSMLTRYPGGLIRAIPFKLHLGLDFLSGVVFLVMSFLFAASAQTVFLILGVIALLFALLTKLNDKF